MADTGIPSDVVQTNIKRLALSTKSSKEIGEASESISSPVSNPSFREIDRQLIDMNKTFGLTTGMTTRLIEQVAEARKASLKDPKKVRQQKKEKFSEIFGENVEVRVE